MLDDKVAFLVVVGDRNFLAIIVCLLAFVHSVHLLLIALTPMEHVIQAVVACDATIKYPLDIWYFVMWFIVP